MRDFNGVRKRNEKMGSLNNGGGNSANKEIEEFNAFIKNLDALNVPMIGRKFTWYHPNGGAISRIDRVICTRGWPDVRQGSIQEVLNRDVSYHCPILVKNNNYDWGPKLFRMVNCWFQDPFFHEVVKETWQNSQVEGQSAYVLKEKPKSLNKLRRCGIKRNLEI